MKASNEYAALMEACLADFPSREEIGGHLLTIQQLRAELGAARVKERQHEEEVKDLKEILAADEVEKVAIRGDLDLMKENFKRETEGRDRAARRERCLARRSIAREYDPVLDVVRANLQKRKGEKEAEVCLQEVRARIEALTEYNEGGFELEEEVEHLKRQETSLEIDYGLAAVSDSSLRRLDHPQVSKDLINQDRTED